MATFVNTATTPVTAGVATIAPTLPTSWAAGDIVLTYIYGKYGSTTVPTAPTGWTLIKSATGGTVTTGNDAGDSFIWVYGRVMQAGDTAPTYSAGATAPNSWGAITVAYRPGTGKVWSDSADLSTIPWVTANDTTTATPLTGTGTFSTQPVATSGDTLVAFGSLPTDLTSAIATPTITNSGLTGGTSTARAFAVSSVGADSSGTLWDRLGFTGTATGVTTLSITPTGPANFYGPLMSLWLREQTSVSPKATSVEQVSLGSGTTPTTRTLHYMGVRARVSAAASGDEYLRLQLYEGGTARSAVYNTGLLTTSFADYTVAISNAEAAAISSYADLEVRVSGYAPDGVASTFEIELQNSQPNVWLEVPLGSSNVNLSKNISDSITLGDSVARSVGLTRSLLADTVTIAADSVVGNKGVTRTASDAITVATDTITRTAGHPRPLADTVSTSDSIARTSARARTLGDTISVSDSVGGQRGQGRAGADSVTVSDAVAGGRTSARALSDSVALAADSVARAVGLARPLLADSVTTSDSISRGATTARSLSDSIAVSDSVSGSASGSKTTPVERVSLEFGLTPATRTGHTLSVRARVSALASGDEYMQLQLFEGGTARSAKYNTVPLTTSFADYTVNISNAEAASITSYADLEIRVNGYSPDAAASTFEIELQSGQPNVWLSTPISSNVALSRNLSDSISISDSIGRTRGGGRPLADSLTVSDSVVGGLGRARSASDTVTVSNTVTRGTLTATRPLTDSVTLSDVIATSGSRARTIADSISISNTVSHSTGSGGTVPGAPTITSAVAGDGIITVYFTPPADNGGSTIDYYEVRADLYGVNARGLVDAVSVSDSVGPGGSRIRTLSDSWSVSDAVLRVAGKARTTSNTLTVSDAVTGKKGRSLSISDVWTVSDTASATRNIPNPVVRMPTAAAIEDFSASASISDFFNAASLTAIPYSASLTENIKLGDITSRTVNADLSSGTTTVNIL